jgi:DNA-binding Xre family transcriptional regulator
MPTARTHVSVADLRHDRSGTASGGGSTDYRWRLREVMHAQGMLAATDLLEPLAARGITLSAVAVWRLVRHRPTRLSLPVLAALCDIFDCTPGDLIVTGRRAARPSPPLGDRARE